MAENGHFWGCPNYEYGCTYKEKNKKIIYPNL